MDKEIVGAGFYVMEFLEGRVFQNIFMKEVNDEDRRAWCVPSFLLHLTLCRAGYSVYKRLNEELELMYKLEISN